MSRYAAEEGRLVYVGNLPDDVRERDIDDLFHKYGRIRAVDIKTPSRPPPFAFVEFSDRRRVIRNLLYYSYFWIYSHWIYLI